MRNTEIEKELEDMSSAEDFLAFFSIPYDAHVVNVSRLHILQRFHDYLENDKDGPRGEEAWFDYYTRHLSAAYQSFIGSSAQKEKVLKVFQDQKPVFVPLETMLK